MNEKHLLYYEILEALSLGKCPVCAIIKKYRERYFDHIISEQVNDVGFRKTLRKADGFCNFHTYLFFSYRKPLASSIIYEDLYLTELSSLKKDKIILTNSECPVCSIEKDAEKAALAIISTFINDSEFKDALIHSKGLCLPHYKKVLLIVKNVPQWFKDFHLARFEKIAKTLHKYIDAQNVSLGDRRPHLTEEEELEWKEAIKTFAGIEGLKW